MRSRRDSRLISWCALALALCCAVWGLQSSGCERPGPEADPTHPSNGTSQDKKHADLAGKKVLLVHSYHPEYEWVSQVTRGVKHSLEQSGVELEVFYMDTKRRDDEAWKQQAGRAAQRVTEDWKPDVVIAADDNAQEYFAKRYAGQDWPQIVFCGLNHEPAKYGYPAKNVTGIREIPNYAASLEMLKKIVPGARRVAVITDNSPTSAGALKQMKDQETSFETVSWETPDTFEQWQEAVARAQKTADAITVFIYYTVKKDGDHVNMPPREVMEWTVRNSKIPVVGCFVFAVDDGALCGMVESGVEHGQEAGRIARQILMGKKASDFPVMEAKRQQSMLNLRTARQLGITVPWRVLDKIDIVWGEEGGAGEAGESGR